MIKSNSNIAPDALQSVSRLENQFRHLAPSGQPDSVHEISDALYGPFLVGSVDIKFTIAGCQIDAIPFVQLDDGSYRLLNGQVVSPDHAKSLGLDNLEQMELAPAAWMSSQTRTQFLANLEKVKSQMQLAEAADGRQWIVWCNHFHGKLIASGPDSEIEIPFSLWGARLVAGQSQCPAFVCPQNKVETYRLAADDQGTITDVDHIKTCPESSIRLATFKLALCAVTDSWVDAGLLFPCPVRQHRLLTRLGQRCHGCFQLVDPATLQKESCESCRNLARIKPQDFMTDPQLKSFADRHDWLKEARKIKISRQSEQWLVQFQSSKSEKATWRILFSRDSGDVIQVSRSLGWMRGWENIPKNRWPDFI